MDGPHRRTDAGIEAFLPRHPAIAFFVDQIIRYPVGRGDLEHVELAADAIFLDRIAAALDDRDLRLECRVELETGRRRRRIGYRLQNPGPLRGYRGQHDAKQQCSKHVTHINIPSG